MKFNKSIGAKELLQNEQLASILPQFAGLALQNVYSFREIRKRIRDYIVGIFGDRVIKVAGNYLWINGEKAKIIKQLNEIKVLLEAFYNATPSIVKNIRRNTKLMLPYNSIEQVKEIKTVAEKIRLIRLVLENVAYNPDFNSQDSVHFGKSGQSFFTKQKLWMRRVKWR